MAPKKPKLVIIGLDAAVERLLLPWIKEGKLPNLASFIKQGIQGPLESVIQPLTPPAWTAFMTGKNSGKHGIYNFIQYAPDRYSMVHTNGGSRKSDSIWRILNRAGLTVGVMNTPYTYPPEKVDGFQVSGFDTPSADSAFIHPPELKKELEEKIGRLRLDVRYLGAMTNLKKRGEALEELQKSDEQWKRMALYLLENHPQDVMMFTFMSVDTVQHHFWHYMDPNHHGYDAEGAKLFKDAILQVYQRLDGVIGEILAKLDPSETRVIICSDHGQEGISDRTIYVNRILSQAGLLFYKPKNPFKQIFNAIARPVLAFLRATLSSKIKQIISGMFHQVRANADDITTSFNEIDWSRTKAYCNESLASPPCISINVKGLKPEGIVDPSDYEAVVKQVCEAVQSVKDPRTGKTVVAHLHRRDQLYTGPYASHAPDLTPQWWGESQFNAKPSVRSEDHLPPITIEPRVPLTKPEWGGHHTIDGILAVRGAGIKQGAFCKGARLIDMAPTILYMLDLPVPDDMDGKVLTDLFEDSSRKDVQSVGTNEAAKSPEPADQPYSEEEQALVEERLKNLGYLE